MRGNLPQPVTVNDILLAAAVDVLDQAVTLLGEIRDRLPQATPEPARDTLDGPGTADDDPVREPVHVTEPAPARAPRPAKKTTTPKPGKES